MSYWLIPLLTPLSFRRTIPLSIKVQYLMHTRAYTMTPLLRKSNLVRQTSVNPFTSRFFASIVFLWRPPNKNKNSYLPVTRKQTGLSQTIHRVPIQRWVSCKQSAVDLAGPPALQGSSTPLLLWGVCFLFSAGILVLACRRFVFRNVLLSGCIAADF